MNQKHLAAFAAILLLLFAWLFRYEHATQLVFLDRWTGKVILLIPEPFPEGAGS